VIVAVNEPVLSYLVAQSHVNVVGPYRDLSPARALAERDDCLIALLTFRGSISKEAFQRMLQALPERPVQEIFIGKDIYASIKQYFDSDIPDYYVRVLDFGVLNHKVTLTDWLQQPLHKLCPFTNCAPLIS